MVKKGRGRCEMFNIEEGKKGAVKDDSKVQNWENENTTNQNKKSRKKAVSGTE